jgi:hypothetical protein
MFPCLINSSEQLPLSFRISGIAALFESKIESQFSAKVMGSCGHVLALDRKQRVHTILISDIYGVYTA